MKIINKIKSFFSPKSKKSELIVTKYPVYMQPRAEEKSIFFNPSLKIYIKDWGIIVHHSDGEFEFPILSLKEMTSLEVGRFYISTAQLIYICNWVEGKPKNKIFIDDVIIQGDKVELFSDGRLIRVLEKLPKDIPSYTKILIDEVPSYPRTCFKITCDIALLKNRSNILPENFEFSTKTYLRQIIDWL